MVQAGEILPPPPSLPPHIPPSTTTTWLFILEIPVYPHTISMIIKWFSHHLFATIIFPKEIIGFKSSFKRNVVHLIPVMSMSNAFQI